MKRNIKTKSIMAMMIITTAMTPKAAKMYTRNCSDDGVLSNVKIRKSF